MTETTPTRRQIALVYAFIGLAVGGAWMLGGDMPAWQHALRLLAAVLIIPPLIHLLRRRLNHTGHLPLRRLVMAKILLVAAALALDLLLTAWTSHADIFTAVAVAVSVAVGGPLVHNAAPGPAPGRE
ncbi:hypothetical protein [Streptomyces sp. NPDC048419]|uniref:hypothetical protein n=1 Tax=Streptomyces sp. NPDC048419 TaxID=3365547 RepID=UPI0037242E11